MAELESIMRLGLTLLKTSTRQIQNKGYNSQDAVGDVVRIGKISISMSRGLNKSITLHQAILVFV